MSLFGRFLVAGAIAAALGYRAGVNQAISELRVLLL